MGADGEAALNVLGHRWMDNGQSVLSGLLLDRFRDLDALFLQWAAEWRAAEYAFPAFIPAAALGKLDYFHSFPHLVTFPAVLDAEVANLKRFADSEPLGPDGQVRLGVLAAVRDVLTPAACYHFYLHFQGDVLDAPRYLTTRNTCF